MQKSKLQFKIQKISKTLRFQRAFTLIELLIVIAIIGILAAGLLSAINPAVYLNRARDSQKLQGLSYIKNGLEIYYNLTKKYPAVLTELTDPGGPMRNLPGCIDFLPTCFIYGVSADGQFAVTFVKLSLAKDPGTASRCTLEAINADTPGGCLPVNFDKGNWVCAVSGSVNCDLVKAFPLPLP